MSWPAAVTLLTLLLLFYTAWQVGRARVAYGVKAPATIGNELFERHFRVQMNTLENTVAFLPALWLAAWYFNPRWAALAGGLWLAGRIWYALGYITSPKQRSRGFVVAGAAWVTLMAMSTWGIVRFVAGVT
jgi:uncharacterized MAPEG superfamily protein